MKLTKFAKTIIGAGIIFLLLIVLNPSHSSHKNKIGEKFKSKNGIVHLITNAGNYVGDLTKYHDHFLFSTTDILGETVSVGVMGKVIIVRDLDIDI